MYFVVICMSCADELQQHMSSSECEIITCVGQFCWHLIIYVRVEFIVEGQP